MYCNVSVVNTGGNPEGKGCPGTTCKNAVTEGVACLKYNHMKFVNFFCLFVVKEWNDKKNVLVKLTGFHFTHTKIQTLIPKLLFVKFLRITTKGELEVVFIFCNYCFLSLPCSSSWSIISVILDICCPLSLKRHRHFPASLVFLIHTLLQTFLPDCTMASDTCR